MLLSLLAMPIANAKLIKLKHPWSLSRKLQQANSNNLLKNVKEYIPFWVSWKIKIKNFQIHIFYCMSNIFCLRTNLTTYVGIKMLWYNSFWYHFTIVRQHGYRLNNILIVITAITVTSGGRSIVPATSAAHSWYTFGVRHGKPEADQRADYIFNPGAARMAIKAPRLQTGTARPAAGGVSRGAAERWTSVFADLPCARWTSAVQSRRFPPSRLPPGRAKRRGAASDV